MHIKGKNLLAFAIFGNGKILLHEPRDRFTPRVGHDHIENDAIADALGDKIGGLRTLRGG